MAKSETPAMRTSNLTTGGTSQTRSRAKMRANDTSRPISPARMASVILIRQRCFLKLSSCSRRDSGSGASCFVSSGSDMMWGDFVIVMGVVSAYETLFCLYAFDLYDISVDGEIR